MARVPWSRNLRGNHTGWVNGKRQVWKCFCGEFSGNKLELKKHKDEVHRI